MLLDDTRFRYDIHQSTTPAGKLISEALHHPAKATEAHIGRYLDAIADAKTRLQADPTDAQSRGDYTFAVARIFDIVDTAGLQPWKSPLTCPGAARTWSFSLKTDSSRPERDPSNSNLRSADLYEFKGRLVVGNAGKDGLGAPLVAAAITAAPATTLKTASTVAKTSTTKPAAAADWRIDVPSHQLRQATNPPHIPHPSP